MYRRPQCSKSKDTGYEDNESEPDYKVPWVYRGYSSISRLRWRTDIREQIIIPHCLIYRPSLQEFSYDNKSGKQTDEYLLIAYGCRLKALKAAKAWQQPTGEQWLEFWGLTAFGRSWLKPVDKDNNLQLCPPYDEQTAWLGWEQSTHVRIGTADACVTRQDVVHPATVPFEAVEGRTCGVTPELLIQLTTSTESYPNPLKNPSMQSSLSHSSCRFVLIVFQRLA